MKLPHKKQILDFVYVRVDPHYAKKQVWMKDGQWGEIEKDEAMLVNSEHLPVLERIHLQRCNGATVYRTQKEAERGSKNNIKEKPTE